MATDLVIGSGMILRKYVKCFSVKKVASQMCPQTFRILNGTVPRCFRPHYILSHSLKRTGRKTSLSEKYVKPHRLAKGELLTSIGKSSTSVTETFTIAINQLRILRNNLFHLTKAEIDTKTFGSYIQLSEKAFGFLNVATASIKAISSYSEDDFPTEKARKIGEDIMRYMEAELRYIKNEILKESLHITKERNKELLESIIETFGNRERVLQELLELIKSGKRFLVNKSHFGF